MSNIILFIYYIIPIQFIHDSEKNKISQNHQTFELIPSLGNKYRCR